MEEKELTFEEALLRLEGIVASLENGNAPLDKALSLYEEGVSLVKSCSAKLDQAERKIQMLQKNGDGNYETTNFQCDSE